MRLRIDPARALRQSPAMIRLVLVLWLAALAHPLAAAKPKPLTRLAHCTLVPTNWADGDSFRVRTASGEELTLRLYGVDCIELHGNTETLLRRLREQRAYFGITRAGGGSRSSIALARNFAAAARAKTAALLAKPFTVHTRHQDAMGDKRFKRVYAFVTCADGGDLGSTLVRMGLARAYGYDSNHPDGKTAKQTESMLRDLELVAAKRGAGIWAKTDWDQIIAERRAAMENKTSGEE